MMTPYEDISTAKMIASSILPNGVRVDTMQLRYWRPIHGELMTHRDFSRNGASGRAVPVQSVLARNETYIPRFKHNQSGMQPAEYLSDEDQRAAELLWQEAADVCRRIAGTMAAKDGLNIHKQWPNRMIEWFGWIDVLVTSTRWSNWDALRMHPDAQDEIRLLAERMWQERHMTSPRILKPGEWHLPYVLEEDREEIAKIVRDGLYENSDRIMAVLGKLNVPLMSEVSYANKLLLAVSAARACRVSYAKMDGTPSTIEDDMRRYLLLAGGEPLHASPLEHQVRGFGAFDDPAHQGNLRGSVQFRKLIPYECL